MVSKEWKEQVRDRGVTVNARLSVGFPYHSLLLARNRILQ
jgi:hypothetical protein